MYKLVLISIKFGNISNQSFTSLKHAQSFGIRVRESTKLRHMEDTIFLDAVGINITEKYSNVTTYLFQTPPVVSVGGESRTTWSDMSLLIAHIPHVEGSASARWSTANPVNVLTANEMSRCRTPTTK